MEFTTISDTGIYDANFNGHWTQIVIFSNENKEKFRIVINQTSPKSELYKWSNEKGWIFILTKNTIRDFGLDTAYRSKERIYPDTYKPIITALKKLAQNF